MSRKLRTLVLADDCNPDWPSLPVVGYKTVRALAQHAAVTVATHVRNREALEREAPPGIDFHYVDNEYVASPLFKLEQWLRGGDAVGWTTSMALRYPAYLAFEREVWQAFREPLGNGEFDLVHRVTPMSPTLPSLMASRCPVPFVIGPLNGGLAWPASYAEEQAREKEGLSKLRDLHRWLPYYQSTFAGADAILAAFAHTIVDLPEDCRHRAVNFPEVGIDPEVFRSASVPRRGRRLEFLFAGRLVPYKLPDLVVECFERSPTLRNHHLTVVGSGPEEGRMKERIRSAGLESCVSMLGWKSQDEVGELMRRADVFVFPSIRELGAGVVAEAMASALCCVAVDYGGPSELLADGRGIKIGLVGREALTERFVERLEQLAREPDEARQRGRRARAYALQNLSWDVKAQRMVETYRWALGQHPARPSFYGPDSMDIAAAA